MKPFLSRIFQFRLVSALLLVFSVFLNTSVSAQVERAQTTQKSTATTMQVAAVNSKSMPANTSLADICNPARKTSRQQGNELTVACKSSKPSTSSTIKAKPNVQRSDVNCKFTETEGGGFEAKSCSCKADSDSNCTGFITWCAKQGGDVGGNNQSASCG